MILAGFNAREMGWMPNLRHDAYRPGITVSELTREMAMSADESIAMAAASRKYQSASAA